jgi:hypothetical protein
MLLSKLEFYGVKGKAKSWFESYISDRYQRVLITSINTTLNHSSAWGKAESVEAADVCNFLPRFRVHNR